MSNTYKVWNIHAQNHRECINAAYLFQFTNSFCLVINHFCLDFNHVRFSLEKINGRFNNNKKKTKKKLFKLIKKMCKKKTDFSKIKKQLEARKELHNVEFCIRHHTQVVSARQQGARFPSDESFVKPNSDHCLHCKKFIWLHTPHTRCTRKTKYFLLPKPNFL